MNTLLLKTLDSLLESGSQIAIGLPNIVMAEINIVVALGPPSSDTFYLGVGRQVYHNNLPRALVQRIENGLMANTRLNYISLDQNAQSWCSEEMVGPTVSFEAPIGGPLDKHIRDIAPGGFVTFPSYDSSKTTPQPFYFVASKYTGKWTAYLPQTILDTLNQLRPHIPNCDTSLKWIIFGAGGTHIYQFANGYLACMEGEHQNKNHPLNEALRQFDPDCNKSVAQGEWMIDKGSSISLHDPQYFFLKFKNTRTGLYELRFCLPPLLKEKLHSMLAFAKTPGEQKAIAMEQQIIVNQVSNNLRGLLAVNNMANLNTMQAGLSFSNAAGDVQYEYVQKKKRSFF
ncbi:hypothetical protein CVT24_008687 [Panaeolus cyanescens]|uniref:Uncharacterized protein n=1 Tax=Panaeolus cyanescens TaxID=181874 RepID=A0A409VKR5_9AGAR|nr:hypothetical protein CVT24_008687 [Panaeolus cyanescens]